MGLEIGGFLDFRVWRTFGLQIDRRVCGFMRSTAEFSSEEHKQGARFVGFGDYWVLGLKGLKDILGSRSCQRVCVCVAKRRNNFGRWKYVKLVNDRREGSVWAMALQGPVSRMPFALRRTVSRMARTGAGTLCSMWMAVVVVILPLIAPDLFPSSSWQTAIFSVRMGFPSSKLTHLDSVCTISSRKPLICLELWWEFTTLMQEWEPPTSRHAALLDSLDKTRLVSA